MLHTAAGSPDASLGLQLRSLLFCVVLVLFMIIILHNFRLSYTKRSEICLVLKNAELICDFSFADCRYER